MSTVIRVPGLNDTYRLIKGKFYHNFDVNIDTQRPLEFVGDPIGSELEKKYWVHIRIQNSLDSTGRSDLATVIAYYYDMEMAVEIGTQLILLWNKYSQKKVVDLGDMLKEAEGLYRREKELKTWELSHKLEEAATEAMRATQDKNTGGRNE